MVDNLKDYEVVIGVCGGIAAYKVCSVVSDLVQRGAGVQVAMTEAATKFVGPISFQALSGRYVYTSMWSTDSCDRQQHIQLTESADLMLVAPATANMIGKAAQGIADDLVSTMIMSADCPVLFAPCMNSRMWENAVVQKNVKLLRQRGYKLVGPTEGWLACRTVGPGRLADPEVIVEAVIHQLKTDPPKSKTG